MTQDATDQGEYIAAISEVDVVGSRDWFLQSIIETVIAGGVEIGVTLTIGGAVVSGILINGRKYFEELGASIATSSKQDGDLQSVMAQSWKGYASIYDKPDGAPDDWSAPPAGFLHLRNARYFSPGQPAMPKQDGMLWRCKLSSVDGFSLVNITT